MTDELDDEVPAPPQKETRFCVVVRSALRLGRADSKIESCAGRGASGTGTDARGAWREVVFDCQAAAEAQALANQLRGGLDDKAFEVLEISG